MTPLTPETEATVLLCGALSGSRASESVPPLSGGEFSAFLRVLDQLDIPLGEVLSIESHQRLLRASVKDVDIQNRIVPLLERGASLAIAIERWESRGVWVVDRSHPDYPARYRDRLGDHAPPLLFGSGDTSILSHAPIVGVVGSRDLDEDGEQFAVDTGRFAALGGATILSGGARGADRAAISGAIQEDGFAVAVLPGDLERSSTSRMFRDAILAGHLALASPYHPNARFTVGNAMGRNRLIYALADMVIVVNAAEGSGGTWSGAVENLRAGWAPVFVRVGDSVDAGNHALVEHGARPVDAGLIEDSVAFRHWLGAALDEADTPAIRPGHEEPAEPQQLGLFPE